MVDIEGVGPENIQDTDSGSYSIDGNSLTIVCTDSESDGPETYTFTINGSSLVLNNFEMNITFEKP